MGLREKVVHILKSYVLPLYAIGFAFLLVLLVFWLAHNYKTGAYWNAKRARSAGDITRATQLFEKAIREDGRLSGDALLALMKIDEPEGLSHMIELIDVPEMNYITVNARAMMCEAIRKRTAGTTAELLGLDPRAPQGIRAAQKQYWQAWLAKAKNEYDWRDGKFVSKQPEN